MSVATKILVVNPNATTVLCCYCHPLPWKCFGGKRSYRDENYLHGNISYANEVPRVAIWFMTTNEIAWQIVLLPRYGYCGNNMLSLATNKIAWQMILLPRHNDSGNNTWSLATNKFTWQMILLPRHNDRGNNVWSLAMNRITWQMILLPWATMVARNHYTHNAKLASVAIPYCNVTFCNHWQRTWFGCNIFLLQPN